MGEGLIVDFDLEGKIGRKSHKVDVESSLLWNKTGVALDGVDLEGDLAPDEGRGRSNLLESSDAESRGRSIH